ncbi:MAG: NAD(P)H-dependent glycerol-3-phosphate dehydrogenase [Gammaproteobacteria bacterium]
MNRRTAATIAVLGAGSWGTALALALARDGGPTRLWGRDGAHMEELQRTRRNERYLPGFPFPDHLTIRSSLADTAQGADLILVAVPCRGFRTTLEQLARIRLEGTVVGWATKGLEPGTGKLLHEVAEEVLGPGITGAVISGPTFAREVAAGLPAAVTVASRNPAVTHTVAERLHHPSLRAYTSDDVVGVELGGAVKNALAIAAGIADGLGFGANARAALITRGLAEMIRLGEPLGGQRDTFIGLAGLGDLVLTCTDNQSRNRRVGLALARGATVEQALQEIGQVVEGVPVARELVRRARAAQVEIPITEQVYRVLFEGLPPRDAVRALLVREQKAEHP